MNMSWAQHKSKALKTIPAGTHLYTWVEGDAMRVKCVPQKCNTMTGQGMNQDPSQRCQSKQNIKIWEIANFTFLALKTVFHSTAANSTKYIKYQKKKFLTRMLKVSQIVSGSVFYAIWFVLSRRFGDWYVRPED